jgi:hypothetical protein
LIAFALNALVWTPPALRRAEALGFCEGQSRLHAMTLPLSRCVGCARALLAKALFVIVSASNAQQGALDAGAARIFLVRPLPSATATSTTAPRRCYRSLTICAYAHMLM